MHAGKRLNPLSSFRARSLGTGLMVLVVLLSPCCRKEATGEGGERKPKPGISDFSTLQLGIEWVQVPGGEFKMGSGDGASDEQPVHTLQMSSFHISRYEITFQQYDRFCRVTGRPSPDDSGWGRKRRPAIHVSWDDAMAFCTWVSEKTGRPVYLPTEAQWEYAARGGPGAPKRWPYAGGDIIDHLAWYRGNSDSRTHPVGQKAANELGLYDMSGNVWEWCRDWYGEDYYRVSPPRDPQGPEEGRDRVVRGGSWNLFSYHSRVGNRNDHSPGYRHYSLGFRVVMEDSSSR